MRPVLSGAQNKRESGRQFELELIHLTARDRETGDPVDVGFWNGPDTTAVQILDMFTNNNITRTFYPGLFNVEEPEWVIGLDIRPITISMNSYLAEIELAFRGYETRFAPIQGHKRAMDPDTGVPIGTEQWFCGYINSLQFNRPAVDVHNSASRPQGGLKVEVVSSSRFLTITSPNRKSHSVQRKRNGDMLYQYRNSMANIKIPWGKGG